MKTPLAISLNVTLCFIVVSYEVGDFFSYWKEKKLCNSQESESFPKNGKKKKERKINGFRSLALGFVRRDIYLRNPSVELDRLIH